MLDGMGIKIKTHNSSPPEKREQLQLPDNDMMGGGERNSCFLVGGSTEHDSNTLQRVGGAGDDNMQLDNLTVSKTTSGQTFFIVKTTKNLSEYI